MEPGARRTSKVTASHKRLIKLQQVLDDTSSLTDLVHFARTDSNLTINRETVSLIFRDFEFRILHLKNLELLMHKDVLELIGVINI